jgi:anti-sigma B factor antagonist
MEPDMREFHLETVGPIGDCAVIQVTGEVDVYTAPMLREQIRELAAKGAVHLIADLSRVDFLDSTALGALVGGLKRLREAGGSLALVISTPRILRIFQITGLTKALAARRSVEDAVNADTHWQEAAESEAGSVHEWCRQHNLS